MTRPHPYDKQIGEKDAQLGSKDEERYNDKDGWYYKQGWDATNAKIEEVKDYELKNGMGSWYSDHTHYPTPTSSLPQDPPQSYYFPAPVPSKPSALSETFDTVGEIFSFIGECIVGIIGISVPYFILFGFAGPELRAILPFVGLAAIIGMVVWNWKLHW